MDTIFYKILNKDGEVVYIGVTTRTIKKRFGEHLKSKRLDPKLYSIVEFDRVHHLEISSLEIFYEERRKVAYLERKYIKEAQESGANLLNLSEGGEWGASIVHRLQKENFLRMYGSYDGFRKYIRRRQILQVWVRSWVRHRTSNPVKVWVRSWVCSRASSPAKVWIKQWVRHRTSNPVKGWCGHWVRNMTTSPIKVWVRSWIHNRTSSPIKVWCHNWVRNRASSPAKVWCKNWVRSRTSNPVKVWCGHWVQHRTSNPVKVWCHNWVAHRTVNH